MRLTKPQQLIYEMDKFVGGSISVICGSFLMPTVCDVVTLKKAVNELFRRNDALRIRIVDSGTAVSQYIDNFTQKDVEVLYFEDKKALDEYCSEYAKLPIDLNGVLCELKIIYLPEQSGAILKLHHIISDAWTVAMIANQFYAFVNGKDTNSYSYAEYITAEDDYLQSKRYQKDRDFHLQQFGKCEEILYISEGEKRSYESVRKTFVVNQAVTEIILQYAKRVKLSPFVLFTAALAVYFNRIKMNAEKFFIGTAVLNRTGVREKNTMGMFINTVPMLMELDNNASFAENLASVKASAYSALMHQKFNYSDVLTELRKKFGFKGKLYDFSISYQNASLTDASCSTTWYHSGCQTESLQMHIDDRDNEGIFRIHYDYQTEVFTESAIERLHTYIINLLLSGIANDTQLIHNLPMLTEEERNTVLYAFNNTSAEYPKDRCIHQLIEDNAAHNPKKTAVVAIDRTLTYARLNEESNRIAHALLQKGIGKGCFVAVLLPRNSHLIPAILGVLKTGAAFLPLDPSYPQERIDYLTSECKAAFRIDETTIVELLNESNGDNPDVKIEPDDFFCALHTSGSTGKPKLTVLRHRNLLNFLYANADFWRDVETVISVTIVTFDIFMQDSLLSLAYGKKVVLASNDQIFNQHEFEKLFESENHVMFFSTPTKLTAYIKQSKTREFMKKIRSLIVGGEVFTDELYDLLLECNCGGDVGNGETQIVFNAYGPAETTLWVTKDIKN